MIESQVVTCFLTAGGGILLLRRSDRVGTYRHRWAGVSGFVEGNEKPQDRAWQEIREETGLDRRHVELLKVGKPFPVTDPELGRRWIVHPFLFQVRAEAPAVCLDREHDAHRWIAPGELANYPTVPKLAEAFQRIQDAMP